ncbi:MAG: cysteine desulfurase [Clostridiales bacterium]|nr:cysteine desulfurase [Clostridiales bacterium]
MIYLDNAATTFLLNSASEELIKYSCTNFFNASAIYGKGLENKKCIDSAKETIANALGATFADNIIFTGSATESNNLAIRGAYRKGFGKMIFSIGEHPSVYNVALELKKHGANVEFVGLQANGEIDYADLENMLDESVSFISIIHVSNETGAINDLKRINELRNKYCPKAIFHSDGVQAFGKVKINVDYFGVDMYTVSGHKAFAPKGIGALYVKKNKVVLTPIIFGGGQEYNLRSGTENVGSIMAFKNAVENFGKIKQNYDYVKTLFDAFVKELEGTDCKINSYHSPYVLSLSFNGVNGETLVHMMETKDILISRGSACSSKKSGNRILESIGLTNEQILGSVRVSFNKFNTMEEVITAGKTLKDCYVELLKKLH